MYFEYKTVKVTRTEELMNYLNTFGKNEWELVSTIAEPTLGNSKYALVGISQEFILIFKRPMEPKKEA